MSVLNYMGGGSNQSRRSSISITSSWKGIDNQSSTSADDIFKNLTIKQIQLLNQEYKQNINVAKDQIHQLVGSKYRDLIDIADDIDAMYQSSSTIDGDISLISYQKSHFVSFTAPDNKSQFDSKIRHSNADASRKLNHASILKNLLTNTLMSFDIYLNKGDCSPYSLIYHAKFYYSIEVIFKHLLANDPALAIFYDLKNNFNTYLENQLCMYVTGYSQDVERSLKLKNVFIKNNSVNDSTLADEDIDRENTLTLEEEQDDVDEEEKEEDTINENYKYHSFNTCTTISNYYKSLSPIENYLIAYIILNKNNPELNTLQKILDSVVNLRFNFLSSLFADIVAISSIDKRVNFYKILKYIENTFDFTHRFFGKDKHDSFKRTLKVCTDTWKASDVIGFKNWFENEKILYEIEAVSEYSINLDNFADLLCQFIKELIQIDGTSVEFVVLTFQGFMHGLQHIQSNFKNSLEVESNLATNESPTIALLKKQHILTQYCTVAIDKLETIYLDHFNELISDDKNQYTISCLISQKNASTSVGNRLELFTPEIFTLLNNDIDKYMETISQISNKTTFNLSNKIDVWFNELSRLDKIICLLKRKYFDDTISKFITSNLTKLETQLHDIFWVKFEKLLSNLKQIFTNNKSINNCYYNLDLAIKLYQNIQDLKVEDYNGESFKLNKLNVENFIESLFSTIINEIPNKSNGDSSFTKLFDKFVTNNSQENLVSEKSEIPTRPNLQLTSYIYKLATDYLDTSVNNGYSQIFQQSLIKGIFIKLKNEWLSNLSQRIKVETLEDLANYVYITEFINAEPKLIDFETKFSKNDIDSVQKNIHEFYNCSKHLYLPLSL